MSTDTDEQFVGSGPADIWRQVEECRREARKMLADFIPVQPDSDSKLCFVDFEDGIGLL